MPDRPRLTPAIADVRRAVRGVLEGLPPDSLVLVALSGGPDSLALAVLGIEFGQHAGDFPRVERYLDGLRKETFRAAGEREDRKSVV